MTRRKTHEEYEEQLFALESDAYPIERYVTAKEKILHECIEGHQWKVSPFSVLAGTGCPVCANNITKTAEQYSKECQFKVLEEYKTNHTPILHECALGHQWKAMPSNVLRGTGCPVCSKSGFDSTKPAMLYFIEFDFEGLSYFKLGVTNKSLRERFIREWNKLSIRPVWIKEYGVGREAWDAETKLKRLNRQYKVDGLNAFQKGNTEIYSVKIEKPGD